MRRKKRRLPILNARQAAQGNRCIHDVTGIFKRSLGTAFVVSARAGDVAKTA
jgi:hypothetical protein